MPFSSNVCEELAAANKPISCSLSSNFQISPFISRHKGAIKLHRLAGALFDDEPHTMSAANVFNDAHSTVTYLFYALVFHYNFLQTYIWQWAVFNKCILPVFFSGENEERFYMIQSSTIRHVKTWERENYCEDRKKRDD